MMIRIKVKFLAHLSDQVGFKELNLITDDDLSQAIREIELITGYPLQESLDRDAMLLINGKSYCHHLKNSTKLKEGDTLAVVPILGGG